MTSTRTALDVRRIGGRIGADVLGVDLASPTDVGHVIEGNEAGHYTPKAA